MTNLLDELTSLGVPSQKAYELFSYLVGETAHRVPQPDTVEMLGDEGLVRFVEHPGVFAVAATSTLPMEERTMDRFLRGIMGDRYQQNDGASADYCAFWRSPGIETMVAGQLCYMSWEGGSRTPAHKLDQYVSNLLQQKHGSVLEHTHVSMIVYGIGRDLSHEWVRHRAGWGYSQVSQRYVDDRYLRFTIRPEIGLTQKHYRNCAAALKAYQEAVESLRQKIQVQDGVKPSEVRKKLRQAARSYLPNCVETALYVTGNLRAWRTFLDQRSSPYADSSAQEVSIRCFQILRGLYPLHFADYRYWAKPDEYGIWRVGVSTENSKVLCVLTATGFSWTRTVYPPRYEPSGECGDPCTSTRYGRWSERAEGCSPCSPSWRKTPTRSTPGTSRPSFWTWAPGSMP